MEKHRKIVFVSNTLLLLLLNYCMTTTVVFIGFTDWEVDDWRVEPLLKIVNYINGALIAEMERANNRPTQQRKPSCQEFSSWRGEAREKPMFPINSSLVANTIIAKSPILFVHDRVSDWVPDWVSDGVLEWVLEWVSKEETWCNFAL